MSNYSIALFLHIVGALGFFVVLGLEWIALSQIKNATLPDEVRALVGVVKSTNRLGSASMLTAVISGFYMMFSVWGSVGWLVVSLGAIVLEIVLFVALTGPWIATIERALTTEKGPVSQTFHDLVNHPILWISLQTRVAILLGMVFLKIAKPDWGASLLAIGAAGVLGIASVLPVLFRGRAQERSAS